MKNNRRDFIRLTGITGLGLAGSNFLHAFGAAVPKGNDFENFLSMTNNQIPDKGTSIIGAYGNWASGLINSRLPSLSFRNKSFNNIDSWKKTARKRLAERLSIPETGPMPEVTIKKQYEFDGLHIEEISWQLPYGPATDAILLKPANARGKFPAILAFHDHGGVKFWGTKKITRTTEHMHPMMEAHQRDYYEGMAWANEIAKRGYVVLVADAFPFASRRVLLKDVPENLRDGKVDPVQENEAQVIAYNEWASNHEHIMSKSLFCAGTTWPGVFFAEDKKALDILCARADVDVHKIGCAGLSGGGMRTVFMAGQDDRIKCAVCVGFMTTWKDFLLHKSYTHTWMTYVPLLPNELDFPEILGLRAPLPTLVLNDSEDELYTMPEMKAADTILAEVFKKAGASDKYKCSYYPGPHKFDKAMQTEAFNWFDKWLKN